MRQPKEVLHAKIICAAKEIQTHEKTARNLRDIYLSALNSYFRLYGDPGRPFKPEQPEFAGAVEYTSPYYRNWKREKRKIYNARQRLKRATLSLMMQE